MTNQQVNEQDITLRCKSCSCAIFKIHGGNEVECVECKRASPIMNLQKEYYDENKQTIMDLESEVKMYKQMYESMNKNSMSNFNKVWNLENYVNDLAERNDKLKVNNGTLNQEIEILKTDLKMWTTKGMSK